jgi:hypothetical protein
VHTCRNFSVRHAQSRWRASAFGFRPSLYPPCVLVSQRGTEHHSCAHPIVPPRVFRSKAGLDCCDPLTIVDQSLTATVPDLFRGSTTHSQPASSPTLPRQRRRATTHPPAQCVCQPHPAAPLGQIPRRKAKLLAAPMGAFKRHHAREPLRRHGGSSDAPSRHLAAAQRCWPAIISLFSLRGRFNTIQGATEGIIRGDNVIIRVYSRVREGALGLP